MNACPCGSGRDYEACCQPIISGQPAPTAEALMRSRYSAYAKHEYAHLGTSLTAAQAKDFDVEQTRRWSEQSEWLGLQIVRTEQGGPGDESGTVEFIARFRTEGEEHEHHEIAQFTREAGRWAYAGQVAPRGTTVKYDKPKVGRNDPCPCGSGKKYKKCCGAV